MEFESVMKDVNHNMNSKITSYREITAGRVHNTFKIKDRKGNKYFIKIATDKNKIDSLNHSKNVIKSLNKTPIKKYLPEIVHYYNTEDYSYILTPYYETRLFDLKSPNILNIIEDCAIFLNLLHNQNLELIDDFSKKQPHTKWLKKQKIRHYRDCKIQDTKKYSQYIEKASIWIENNHSPDQRIIHNDLYLPNLILHNNGSINYVIDWEMCTIGDSAYDIAKFETRFIELYSKYTRYHRNQLLNYFRKIYGVSTDMKRAIKAYKLLYSIRTMEKYLNIGGFKTWEELSPMGETGVNRYMRKFQILLLLNILDYKLYRYFHGERPCLLSSINRFAWDINFSFG